MRWVRIELTTLGLWDLRAANCAITAAANRKTLADMPHVVIHGMARDNMHQPGIEPRSHRWQRCILPLDHWCCWVNFWNVTLLYRTIEGCCIAMVFYRGSWGLKQNSLRGVLVKISCSKWNGFWRQMRFLNFVRRGAKNQRSSKFLGVRETASSRQTVFQNN